MRATGIMKLVHNLRATIAAKLQAHKGPARGAVIIPADHKYKWYKDHFRDVKRLPPIYTPPWLQLIPEQIARQAAIKKQRADHRKATVNRILIT